MLEGPGHEKYHLVGLSRGGWLALNQAIRSPERVGRVTGLDPGGFLQSLNKGRLYLFVGLMTMLAPEFLRRRIKPDSKLAVFAVPTRLVLGTRSTIASFAEVADRVARLAPHVEVVPADLHHGLGFLEPDFLREQVTASEQLRP